jgi:osmotically-inducible protein OsmY
MNTKITIRNALITTGLALYVVLLNGCDKNETSNSSAGYDTASRNSDVARDVDNTAKNARDRNDATLTPGDQGNSPTDRATTQNIRKALVSGPTDYSTTAQNIKIITIDGRVTLRGPVKSAVEKAGIVALAKNIAGDANVDDQLEIKSNP